MKICLDGGILLEVSFSFSHEVRFQAECGPEWPSFSSGEQIEIELMGLKHAMVLGGSNEDFKAIQS